ncbi:MAG: hypothetical protein K0Q74_140 [Gammaproteobacteria bacterium]|nr:hypothetical protein [Gammaproteobacteria bacterium]
MRTRRYCAPFIQGLVLSFCLLVSAAASAIEPTEVQLDKLSPEQLRQAAEAGDPDAQYALGYMYYYGSNGVSQDTRQAMNWIKRASVQGQKQATKALALMQPGGAQAAQSAPAESMAVASSRPNVTEQTKTASSPPFSSSIPAKKGRPSPVQAITTKAATPNASGAFTSEEQRLLTLPSDHYTIQVLGSYSERDITSYINKHDLGGKVAYYRTSRDGRDWYVVLYSSYKTSTEAKAAISGLPAEIQKQKPWVKLLGSVQEDIKRNQA